MLLEADLGLLLELELELELDSDLDELSLDDDALESVLLESLFDRFEGPE